MHIVPQHYQKAFADASDPEYIWMYDKKAADKPRRLPIKSVLQRKRYFPEADEQDLSTLESRGNKVLDKLQERQAPSAEDKLTLSLYIQVMLYRVPGHRARAESIMPFLVESAFSGIERRLNNREALDLSIAPIVALKRAELRRLQDEWRKELPDDVWRNIIHLPRSHPNIVWAIQTLTWSFLVAEDASSFVTSDNPVSYSTPQGLCRSGFLFPVSKNIALFATHSTGLAEAFLPVGRDVVHQVNRITIKAATRHVLHSANEQWLSAEIRASLPPQP